MGGIKNTKSIILSASLTVSTIADILKSNGMYEAYDFVGILDDSEQKQGKEFFGLKVIGAIKDLEASIEKYGLTDFVVGFGAVQHMLMRGSLFNRSKKLGLKPVEVVHDQVYISAGASLGEGQIVLPFASISPGCSIGNNCCINNSVSILESTVIGYNVLIAGNTFVGAKCVIGDNVYIGPGTTIGSGVSIGSNSVIGAGSLVLKNIPGNSFAHGSPISKISENCHYLPSLDHHTS